MSRFQLDEVLFSFISFTCNKNTASNGSEVAVSWRLLQWKIMLKYHLHFPEQHKNWRRIFHILALSLRLAKFMLCESSGRPRNPGEKVIFAMHMCYCSLILSELHWKWFNHFRTKRVLKPDNLRMNPFVRDPLLPKP